MFQVVFANILKFLNRIFTLVLHYSCIPSYNNIVKIFWTSPAVAGLFLLRLLHVRCNLNMVLSRNRLEWAFAVEHVPVSPERATTKKNRIYSSFSPIVADYHKVRNRRLNSGDNLEKACKSVGISRSTFHSRIWVVEMIETDPDAFKKIHISERRIERLNKICKERLQESPLKSLHSSYKKQQKLL